MVRLVAKNGLPRMMGTSSSSSMSRIMKSVGKMSLLTLTSTSSTIPLGNMSVLSASYRETEMGIVSPICNFLKIEKGIKLTLTPKSHKALPKSCSPMVQGTMKLPGSFNFGGSFL